MPLVGDPSLFAIEWQETWRDVTQVYGHFCLWVSGVRLGNYEDSISLRVPTGWLRNFLANADQHHIEFLDGASKEEIFAQVYDTVYSSGSRGHNWALFERMRDVWQLQDIWSLHSRLGRLHLSDIGNEAFDQVNIVLLDDHLRHTQRLIWRDRRDMQLYDGDLPDQVFASISREFLAACVMPVALADLFSTSGDRPIEVDGRMVHRKFQRQLQGWMEVHVKRLHYNTLIPQGLRIKSGKVELEYDGQRVRDLVLWADNSPQDCMLRVIGQQGAVLKCWNVWQSGGVAALQGPSDNAGMVIEEMSDGVRLLCSDGVGEPDFEDFIVELRFDRATQHESELSSRFRS